MKKIVFSRFAAIKIESMPIKLYYMLRMRMIS